MTGRYQTTTDTLTPADIELFAQLRIPRELLERAGVHRVTDREARELLSSRYKGNLAGLFFPYHDPVTGYRVSGRLRRDHPDIEEGKPKAKYLSPNGDNPHVYFAPGVAHLLDDACVLAVVIEAEKSALAIAAAAARAQRRVLAIATGGCWSWRGRRGKTVDATGARVPEKGAKNDFDRVVWTGRDTVIAFDANVGRRDDLKRARARLAAELAHRGAHVRIATLPTDDPTINGPDDLIAMRGDDALWHVIDGAGAGELAGEGRRPSQATLLVDLVCTSGAELWHTADGEAYATIGIGDHTEHHRLSSQAIRDWLGRLHYQDTGRTASSQAIADALTTLRGMARYDGDEHAVFVRVARLSGSVYLDLGDPSWRAVEITAAGWRLVTNPTVRFRRGRHMLALPAPEAASSVDVLRELIHLEDDDDWYLLVGFLLGALRANGPYPVLALDGEHGSGKSTTVKMLRRLIDPSKAELRAEPREIRDLMVAAAWGHVVALDNMSRLQPWLSDTLCRLSTGGALSTRALYTDEDEHVIEAVRPCILNGISNVITRGDLQDRAIPITMPVIPEKARRSEEDLWRCYDRLWPSMLGALLDTVSAAIRRESSIHLRGLPRMADWAIWVTAGESPLGCPDETIVSAYRARMQSAVEASLDGDALALAIRNLSLPWSGTSSELLKCLTPPERPRGWPETPRSLSAALARLAPLLRRIGINVGLPKGARAGRERQISIETIGAQQDTSDRQDAGRSDLSGVSDPALIVSSDDEGLF